MGQTLKDILEDDFGMSGAGVSEKTASQESPETDEIEKLAAEIGLYSQDQTKEASVETKPSAGQTKEANMGLASLFGEMFPEDAVKVSQEVEKVAAEETKVAAEEKVAAEKEEAMGAVAFDSFAQHFDNYITKMAEAVSEQMDGKPSQTMKDNQPADSHNKIDTTPQVADSLKAQSGAEVSGKEEQKAPAGNGEQIKAAAMRKALLASALEG